MYRLGDFELQPATRALSRGGAPVRLTQKPFQVLLYLVEQRDRLVPRAELLEKFWGGREVYDVALTRCLSFVRKALDDQGETARYIETRWAEGYRYIGPFAEELREDRPAPARRRLALAAAAVVALGAAGWSGWQAWRPAPASAQVGRIAVLPVRSEPSPAEPWLTDGLTHQLIDSVSRIEGLTVIARNSTRGFTEALPDAQAIGRDLKVDAILVPSVAREGGELHLTARLVSTADGEVMWIFGSQFPLADMMKAERELALALTTQLAARLRSTPPRPRDEKAYAHYLRGRWLWNQRTEPSLAGAIAEFEAALAAEPGYAEAHTGLAESLLMLPLYAGRPPDETRARARAEAEAALRLDPAAARAYLVLGVVAQFDWDWGAADAHFNNAVAANPSDATAQQWRAESLCYRRRFAECLKGLRDAQALDPLSPVIAMVQATARRWAGDHAGASAAYQQIAQRWPGFAFLGFERGKGLMAAGDVRGAIPHYEAALPTFGIELVGGPLAYAYARTGRRGEALAIRARLRQLSVERYISPVTLAIVELGLGERAAALDAIELAVAQRDELVLYLAVDEHFAELRADARFAGILARIGLGEAPRP